MTPFVTVETRTGQPVAFHGNTLVPFTRVWQLKLPGGHGGLIWNRPASVLVQAADQQETIIPVQDVTRQALWLLFGMSFASLLIAFLSKRRQPSK